VRWRRTKLDGREATIGVLLAALPPAAAADPEIAPVLAADRLASGSLDELAAAVAEAERRATAVPDDRRPRLDVALAFFRLALALRRGDLGAALGDTGPLLALAGPSVPGDIALGNDVRALALMVLGMVEVWPGRQPEAERHLEEGLALGRRIGRPYVEIGCLAHLAMGGGAPSSVGRQRWCCRWTGGDEADPSRATRAALAASGRSYRGPGGPTVGLETACYSGRRTEEELRWRCRC
jgi:LuxR family maltose regulon positive regulatory protein